MPWVSTYTDLGPIIKALIDNPEPYIGREIPIVAELLTMDEIASTYQNGICTVFVNISCTYYANSCVQ